MNYAPKKPKDKLWYPSWMREPTEEEYNGNEPYNTTEDEWKREWNYYNMFCGSAKTYIVNDEERTYVANFKLNKDYKIWACDLSGKGANFEIWKRSIKGMWCYNFKQNKIQIKYDREFSPIYRDLDRDDVELLEEILETASDVNSKIVKKVMNECKELYYKKKEGKYNVE